VSLDAITEVCVCRGALRLHRHQQWFSYGHWRLGRLGSTHSSTKEIIVDLQARLHRFAVWRVGLRHQLVYVVCGSCVPNGCVLDSAFVCARAANASVVDHLNAAI
jgi:hypothetical protein